MNQSQPEQPASTFSYEPPQSAPDESFDRSVSDVISEIAAEYNPDDPAPAPEAAPAPEEAAPAPEAPAEAHGLDRLVAREVALQQKEAAISAREARTAALEQEIATLRKQVPQRELLEKFSTDPDAALEALGLDAGRITRQLVANDLRRRGKEVPQELLNEIKESETRREIQQLRNKIAAQEAQAQAAAYFNSVAAGALQYVNTKVGDSKSFPTLAGIVKTAPDRIHREIMEEITADAYLRAKTDPDGEPISYDEAAARVEARLSSWKALLGPSQQVPDAKQATVGQSRTPPVQQPPAAPLKPWQQSKNALEQQGLDEAIREFNRLEAANRR